MKNQISTDKFRWIPGEGPSADDVGKFRKNFPKPTEAMGEAWFIGKTRYLYEELLAVNFSVDTKTLMEILYEATSGTGSFGRNSEWENWFHYLLPECIERSHENYASSFLLESLISACFVIDLSKGGDLSSSHKHALLETVGRSIMKNEFWTAENLPYLSSEGDMWVCCSGAISSSIFFCLELLDEKDVEQWLDSILLIESPIWRANLLCWFVSANDLLQNKHPQYLAKFSMQPTIDWQNDFLLSGSHARYTFSRAKIAFLFDLTRKKIDLEWVIGWMKFVDDFENDSSKLMYSQLIDEFADYVLPGKARLKV